MYFRNIYFISILISLLLHSNEYNGEVYQQAIAIELSTRRVGATNGVPIILEKNPPVGSIVLRVRPLFAFQSLSPKFTLPFSSTHVYLQFAYIMLLRAYVLVKRRSLRFRSI